MAGSEIIGATSNEFTNQVEVSYGAGNEIQLAVILHGNGVYDGFYPVWMTPKEAEDLIVVLQYALSLMEDTDEVS